MSIRVIICTLSSLASLGMVGGVYIQNRQLAQLRSEQQRVLGLVSPSQPTPSAEPAAATSAPDQQEPNELLQLRNEVNQLSRRKRELQGLEAENENLKRQAVQSQTNRVPFMRKSAARNAGYHSPEATLETFLWALQNRNVTNLLATLTPESAGKLGHEIDARVERGFFEGAEALPGFSVQKSEGLPDGRTRLALQITPEMPTFWLTFQYLDGQWRMDWPPKEQ